MNTNNIAFLDKPTNYRIQEERGIYDAGADAAAAKHARHLLTAQGLVGDALNLAGLLLTALHDQGDRRAMQIEAAVRVIEKKLQKACNRLDKHDARHEKLFSAYRDLESASTRD